MPTEPTSLLRQLETIEPSDFEPGTQLYPCSARMKDGTVEERAYFVAAETAVRLFGPAGIDAVSRSLRLPIDRVVSVAESPARLPAKFANQIYRAGETHYGCYLFTLVFSRWRRSRYMVGGFVDFLFYPSGRGPSDIQKAVLGNGARRATAVPKFKWCVYGS
jgi:hypothetical protein